MRVHGEVDILLEDDGEGRDKIHLWAAPESMNRAKAEWSKGRGVLTRGGIYLVRNPETVNLVTAPETCRGEEYCTCDTTSATIVRCRSGC